MARKKQTEEQKFEEIIESVDTDKPSVSPASLLCKHCVEGSDELPSFGKVGAE